jgi:hypothetical protein
VAVDAAVPVGHAVADGVDAVAIQGALALGLADRVQAALVFRRDGLRQRAQAQGAGDLVLDVGAQVVVRQVSAVKRKLMSRGIF